jgi:hypothetical protein
VIELSIIAVFVLALVVAGIAASAVAGFQLHREARAKARLACQVRHPAGRARQIRDLVAARPGRRAGPGAKDLTQPDERLRPNASGM